LTHYGIEQDFEIKENVRWVEEEDFFSYIEEQGRYSELCLP